MEEVEGNGGHGEDSLDQTEHRIEEQKQILGVVWDRG